MEESRVILVLRVFVGLKRIIEKSVVSGYVKWLALLSS